MYSKLWLYHSPTVRTTLSYKRIQEDAWMIPIGHSSSEGKPMQPKDSRSSGEASSRVIAGNPLDAVGATRGWRGDGSVAQCSGIAGPTPACHCGTRCPWVRRLPRSPSQRGCGERGSQRKPPSFCHNPPQQNRPSVPWALRVGQRSAEQLRASPASHDG